jgi:hypothetical protein
MYLMDGLAETAAWVQREGAREYECDSCGKRQVYGAQEVLIMYFV